MLYLTIDQPKVIYVTLQEKSSNLVNPYYTWFIKNKQSLEETTFYASDFSTVPYYFNTFTMSVSSTQSGLTAGIIQVDSGEYIYQVYQMSSPYDLNLSNAIQMVETGILIISGTHTDYQSYTGSSGNINVYQNLNRI